MKALTIFENRPTWWPAFRRWVARYKLWLGGGAVIALGLALGWNTLAAAGALYLLVCMVPCALMMGMCMKGMGSKDTQSSGSQNEPADDSASTATPAQPEMTSTHTQENDNA